MMICDGRPAVKPQPAVSVRAKEGAAIIPTRFAKPVAKLRRAAVPEVSTSYVYDGHVFTLAAHSTQVRSK